MVVVFLVLMVSLSKDTFKGKYYVDWNSPQFIGSRSGYYHAIFAKQDKDEPLSDKVLEEFEEEKEQFAVAHSNAELIELYGISFKEGTLSDLGVQCNTELFDICNKYFLVSHNNKQVSPLIPMALANIETPGRADHSITYSSLFPSACVTVTSPESIHNMSCLAVLESAEAFKILAGDHWTRDRGSLQMNPNYGVSVESYNSLMGPSEASILANISGAGIDFTGYEAYEPRNGRTITAEEWLVNIASTPGDRHNVRDSILRTASESQLNVDYYLSQYEIDNDFEVMALIAMAHNSGSVWNPAYRTRRVGNWRNGDVARSYLLKITSDDFIRKLTDLASGRLEEARKKGGRLPMVLERKDAKELFDDNWETYVYSGRYYEVTYCYPIQALYSYIMMGLLYSGN